MKEVHLEADHTLKHTLLVLKLTERGLLVVLEPVTGIADGAFDIGVALFASISIAR